MRERRRIGGHQRRSAVPQLAATRPAAGLADSDRRREVASAATPKSRPAKPRPVPRSAAAALQPWLPTTSRRPWRREAQPTASKPVRRVCLERRLVLVLLLLLSLPRCLDLYTISPPLSCRAAQVRPGPHTAHSPASVTPKLHSMRFSSPQYTGTPVPP